MIKVGDIVDSKYCVTRVLGEGGMGTVVEAYRETLDMHVAIKFMRSEMVAANGGAERFLREARALVKLKSQHAVKVHDLGVHGRMPYIVMEHLEGMDMQTALDKHGPMGAADAARHVRQACEAIAEAHSLGIYHRDLKPANLFLARGASGRIIVKVLDFGIAKMMRPPEDKVSLRTSLTGIHVIIGTVPYMSPEQLMSAKDIDARADIWSLGVVLHELVTGELPFQGRDMYEIQQAIRYEACIMPAVAPSLEPIIRRCLEKNRDDRYASAVELAIALRPLTTESLSPFGAAPDRIALRPPQTVNIQSATASPLPTSPSYMKLAVAEGLTVPQTANIAPLAPPVMQDDLENALTERSPISDDAVTLRGGEKMARTGTVVMRQQTPEQPTMKRSPAEPPAPPIRSTWLSPQSSEASKPQNIQTPPTRDRPELKPQVVNVRRGVLVVNQPIHLARRRRPSSKRSRYVVAALAICAVIFALMVKRDKNVGTATSWSEAPLFSARLSTPPDASPKSPDNNPANLVDAFTNQPEKSTGQPQAAP